MHTPDTGHPAFREASPPISKGRYQPTNHARWAVVFLKQQSSCCSSPRFIRKSALRWKGNDATQTTAQGYQTRGDHHLATSTSLAPPFPPSSLGKPSVVTHPLFSRKCKHKALKPLLHRKIANIMLRNNETIYIGATHFSSDVRGCGAP